MYKTAFLIGQVYMEDPGSAQNRMTQFILSTQRMNISHTIEITCSCIHVHVYTTGQADHRLWFGCLVSSYLSSF